MNNVNDRLHVMLGLSRHSITNLRQEMGQLIEHQKMNRGEDLPPRPRRRTNSDAQIERRSSLSWVRKGKHAWTASSILSVIDVPFISSPISPRKKGNSGRKRMILTELEQDMIRYQFHLLLASKEYLTMNKLLSRLQDEIPEFPIQSESSLLHHMHKLGFNYKATSKAPIR